MNLDKSTFPRKTLAGSDFPTMTNEVHEVVYTLNKAIDALCKVYPHPRDYIGQDALYQAANAQHEEHKKTLIDLVDFYESKRDHCNDQTTE